MQCVGACLPVNLTWLLTPFNRASLLQVCMPCTKAVAIGDKRLATMTVTATRMADGYPIRHDDCHKALTMVR